MANVIKHKRGSGSDPAANNLVLGELAIRTDNGKLFTKMDSGAIAEIAGGGSDIAINTLSSSSATGGGSATFNGSAYRFTLSSPPSVSAAQLLVSVNGVIQKPVAGTGQPSEGFSVSGNDIIFGDAPATGADFFILTFRSLGVSEPADNSVTSAKIVDGAIVNADINASAAIAGTKISPDFGSQNIVTTGSLGSGDITITGTNPEIFFTDSNNNSDFRIKLESGIFAIQDTTNSNANRLAIDSSGLVGIGTTSPAAPFHVYNATNNTVARLESGDATARLHLKDNSGETFVEATGDNLIFSNTSSTTERMRIDSSGRVGINQTSFATSDTMLSISELTGHLEVGLLSKNDSACVINFGDPEDYNIGRIKYANDDNSMRFDANDAERMRIDSSGNVGIGTTSPDAALVVKGTVSVPHAIFRVNSQSESTKFIAQTVQDSDVRIGTITNHPLTIYSNSLERVRVDTSGNVGIGTTSPEANLHVHTNANGEGILVKSTGNTSNALTFDANRGTGGVIGVAYGRWNGTTVAQMSFVSGSDGTNKDDGFITFGTESAASSGNVNATERMRIVSNGEVGIGITNPETYGMSGHGYGGLTVQAPSGNNSGITIRSNYAGGGILAFADGNGSNAERKNLALQASHVNKRLDVLVDGAGVARFTEHGFHPNPADSSASTALDDYEEGYWSPTAVDGQTLNVQNGNNVAARRYVKVGKLVTCWFDITFSSGNSGSGQTRFAGLPFTQEANSEGSGAPFVIGYYAGSETYVVGHTDPSNHIKFFANGSAVWSYSNSAGDRVAGCLTYIAA